MPHNMTPDQIEGLLKGFRAFDKDGDGFLTKDEIKHFYLQAANIDEDAAEKELCEFMGNYDVNKDDRINFVEFLHFVDKHL